VPLLLAEATAHDLDVVVASRRVAGGVDVGLSGSWRRFVSSAATWVARSACPRSLKGISDPMSGFFAVRRAAVDVDALHPQGFKILVEIMASHAGLTRGEIPFVFGRRHAGDSKATATEGLRFAGLLLAIRFRGLTRSRPGATRGWSRRFVQFGLVGVTGIFVNSLALWLLAASPVARLPYLLAAVLATQASSLWNFVGYETWVFPGQKRSSAWSRLLRTMLVNDTALILRLPLLAFFVEALGIGVLVANVLTLVVLFLSRFFVSDRFIYAQGA
jgi:dolichol-phosphate mannosyltransferase